MKKFENPMIEVQVFAIEDVVTTSSGNQGGGGLGGDSETEMD